MEEILSAPNCGRENDLIAFLYGEVEKHEAQNFDRHLRNCAECKLELDRFRQIRESVASWRQESLGAVSPHSTRKYPEEVPAIFRAVEPRKVSAMAAIREFLDLSPFWLKGAVAVASVLFCIFAIGTLAHFSERPQPGDVAADNVYTEEELKAKLAEGVQARLEELSTEPKEVLAATVVVEKDRREKTHKRSGIGAIERSRDLAAESPRAPLTKSEREQLAADLRLTPVDEGELDLLGDRLNR